MSSSEFDIIRRFFTLQETGNHDSRADVVLGIGDDAALLSPPPGLSLVVTTDTLIRGVHFPEDTSPEAVGYKSLAVNLSDLAAMGAEPAWFTLSITLPEGDEGWLRQFSKGLFSLAREHHVQLVGGDTTRGPLSITIQAMGFVPEGEALTRGGAQPGDAVFVTGTLGDAGAGLKLRQQQLSTSSSIYDGLVSRLERPTPRIAVGMKLRGLATAAIDISDGLAADLGHILHVSNVGAEISISDLPLSDAYLTLGLTNAEQLAVSCGDDYELCFTVATDREQEVQQRLNGLDCRYTRIGTITPQPETLSWFDHEGNAVNMNATGYDHFI